MSTPMITTSTELMRNYKQATIMAPDSKFEALQTTRGYALLFSIGTDGAFYATEEASGQKDGWVKRDLSAAVTPRTSIRTFAAAQNRASGTIGLAMIAEGAPNDVLYLSLGNSATNTEWAEHPSWVAVPFDDLDHPLAEVEIRNVFISESPEGESIVVDVLRDRHSAARVIFRYVIDPSRQRTGRAWIPHDVAGDIDASQISSCIGRRSGDSVSGIYAMGTIAGHAQLQFQPLYNVFDPSIPANPVRLKLPEGVQGSALAAIPTGDGATDLFVAAGRTIYYFAAAAQQESAAGTALLEDTVFTDVQALYGFGNTEEVILWGLNRANQVFYTRCQRSGIRNAAAWSRVVPIYAGADALSPYLNGVSDANTFFVRTSVNELRRATQAPETTTWKYENILLGAPAEARSVRASSYTTRLHVSDEANAPVPGARVQISAPHRVGVYANGLYTVLDATPIDVVADATGAITIVEWIESIRGTPLNVAYPGAQTAAINPMTAPFTKAASLSSATRLRNACITSSDGTTRPLVPGNVSDDDLKVAGEALAQLNTIYQTLPKDGSVAAHAAIAPPSSPTFHAGRTVSFAVTDGRALAVEPLSSFSNSIEAAAGDILSWLEHAAGYVVHLVKDETANVWHFVVELAGKLYSFVLDATEKVVGALEAVYRAIKTAIKDLLAFLEFLFEWKDFQLTKDVCKKLLILSFDPIANDVKAVKAEFDGMITALRNSADQWSGMKSGSWAGRVENGPNPLRFLAPATSIAEHMTAPAMFLYQHFVENAGGATGKESPGSKSDTGVIDAAIAAMDGDQAMAAALERISAQLIDGSMFLSLSLSEILKRLVAIGVDAFLSTSQALVDPMLDVMLCVANRLVETLDMPMRIPVVSDILEDFGMPGTISILDVVLMAAAIPATLMFKVLHKSAPFSHGDGFTDKVLAAKSLHDLEEAFPADAAPMMTDSVTATETLTGPLQWAKIKPGDAASRAVYVTGHTVSAVANKIAAALVGFEGEESVVYGGFTNALRAASIVGGMSASMAAMFESPMPLRNKTMSAMANATSVMTVVVKCLSYAISHLKYGSNPPRETAALVVKVTSGCDALLALLSLVPTGWHFAELAEAPAGCSRSATIVDETSNVVMYLDRIVVFLAVATKDPNTKVRLMAVAGTLLFLNSYLQAADAMIPPK